MVGRLIILSVLFVGLAACLLALRQERIETAHQIANMHTRILQTRQDLWTVQSDAAKLVRTPDIERRILAAGLSLETASPAPPTPPPTISRRGPVRPTTSRRR